MKSATRARRFHVRPDQVDGHRLRFDGAEARHMGRVLRLAAGDVVTAVDGAGQSYAVRLDTVTPSGATGTIVGAEPAAPESPLHVTLAQGIAKPDAMDVIIRAVTELGVARIAPLVTRRSVVRLAPGRAHDRVARWQRVATEAAKQCGRAVVPPVDAPVDLAALVSTAPADALRLCCWERERRGLGDVLASLTRPPVTAVVLIGPEGGLEDAEVATAAEGGFVAVGLGARILRAQTAGATVLAILQARFGDVGSARGG